MLNSKEDWILLDNLHVLKSHQQSPIDSHDIIQHMTDDLNINAAKVGLHISCEKTKAMFVGEPPTTSISVGSNLLQSVDNFQYLGSYISNQSDIEVDIRARLGKAALVFQRLNRIYGLAAPLTVPSNFVSTHQLCYVEGRVGGGGGLVRCCC